MARTGTTAPRSYVTEASGASSSAARSVSQSSPGSAATPSVRLSTWFTPTLADGARPAIRLPPDGAAPPQAASRLNTKQKNSENGGQQLPPHPVRTPALIGMRRVVDRATLACNCGYGSARG